MPGNLAADGEKGNAMTIPLAEIFEGKKHMWDGVVYETEADAHETAAGYQENGFEVLIVEDTDTFLVYSRKIAAVQTAE